MELSYVTAGESHGPGLTVVISGLPAGLELDHEVIRSDLARRQAGYGRSPRQKLEQDDVEPRGGLRHGRTLGSPLAFFIENRDHRNWTAPMSPWPVDPQELEGYGWRGQPVTLPRPGHADLAGVLKYGHADVRNVLERASARETAGRVAAGAVAKALIATIGITVRSHVLQIGTVRATPPAWLQARDFDRAEASPVRCLDPDAEAAMIAARTAYDAGHARDDAFLEGTKTIAYELFEALGPELRDVITPVGQGTVLIGLAMGFGELVSSGRLERSPRLHGVQSEACAPLVRGASLGRPAPVVRQPSIADGIRIPEPTRAERSYAAVRYSGGRWLAVSEDAIERAWRSEAARGLLIEPTSATALAGAHALSLPAGSVVIITGSGLKAVERY
jgi:hypothetical protein